MSETKLQKKYYLGMDVHDLIIKHFPGDYDVALEAIKELVNIPAADVKPVVRGRWEETGSFSDEMIDWVRCSNCGEEAPVFTDNYDFCPNCGADMRESKDG